jgi:FkbM family methyltransferase
MAMISYAQNSEDVVLARLFDRQAAGRYIDVGAGHPVGDSVTKHFYDAGWRGVNVEPMAHEYQLLCSARPDDVNVHAALSDKAGEATLYEAPPENRGASTLVPDIVDRYDGQSFTPVRVELNTLAEVWERHPTAVDFLKIDVEGHEEAVIRGGAWEELRPRVVVVEATEPNSTEPSHEAWEPLLVANGYLCALFDGVNRFYAQVDDDEALETLAVPANVFDDYEPWKWASQLAGAKDHTENVEAARAAAEDRVAQLEDVRAAADNRVAQIEEEIRALAHEARALDPRRSIESDE